MGNEDESPGIETFDLRQLKAELIREEIRRTRFEADQEELKLAELRDKERDRQVKGGLQRRLPIDGPIMGMTTAAWIDALEHWEYRDPGEPVLVTIDSPGGSVMDGIAIFDTILRLRRKGHFVTTRGRGMIASMAAILMQSGTERVMDENAQFMLHEISFRTGGKVSEMEDDVEFAKKLERRMLNILAERSTMTARQIASKWKKKDWWMSAEEALELGFIDRVE